MDGKSRLVVYLDASGDNRASTNLVSFVKRPAFMEFHIVQGLTKGVRMF